MARKLKNIELNRLTPEEFIATPKRKVSVLLDNIRSMHNVGSFFRTCDAFAVAKLYLCGITAQPPHREITKSALGSDKSVDWEYHKNGVELINQLKRERKFIVGVEQTDQSNLLQNVSLGNQEHIVLIFGNEVEGISDQHLALCDLFVEIPQYGTKHSLNVSVSAGIVLWESLKWLDA